MSEYRLRPKAEDDLAEIWRFTAERWNVEQADHYYGGIVNALVRLAEQPELGRPCDDIQSGYRRYNVVAHVVFYKFESGFVDVVRILHARRDFRRHLPKS
jgi:toxin ParE1/3/4